MPKHHYYAVMLTAQYFKKLRLGNMGSGIILLFLAIQPTSMRKYDFQIDTNFSRILRVTKANIMKKESSNHGNSTGKYYSFGNKGSYKKVGN